MAARLKITERDNGFDAMRKRVDDLGKFSLTVGVQETEGAQTYPGGATVADVAAFQHNGTATIPPRPFLDLTVVNNLAKIREMKRRVATEILAGRMTVEQGLNTLGLALVGMTKKTIEKGIAPELKSREGVPLIDSGQLIGSISHKVVHQTPGTNSPEVVRT